MIRRRTRMALAAWAAVLAGCGGEIAAPASAPPTVPAPLALELPAAAVADRASLVLVTATVDASVSRDKRQVVFTTSAGTFGAERSVTIQADSARVARAYLTPPADTTVAIVSATVGTVTETRVVAFARARAESVQLSADAFVLDTGLANFVTVTAALRRAVGAVSPGVPVRFTRSSAGGAIGRFSVEETVTDTNGVASVRFTAGSAGDPGPVTITASTVGPDQRERTASVVIALRQ